MHVDNAAGRTIFDAKPHVRDTAQDARHDSSHDAPRESSHDAGHDSSKPTASVKHKDGSHTDYQYDAHGKPTQVTEFNADGQEMSSYATKDGKNWVAQPGTAPGWPKLIQGELTVKPDGTHIFHDDRLGTTLTKTPDGNMQLVDAAGHTLIDTRARR